MHQDESNKIPREYNLSSLYTLKSNLNFSPKVEKLKMDKKKETEGVKQFIIQQRFNSIKEITYLLCLYLSFKRREAQKGPGA